MSLTREILEFCFSHSIRIVTKHLPGRLNVLADQASRVEPVSTEWSLDDSTFGWLSREYGPFQVDLFATHLNAKLDAYVSPCPDKQACGINAFSLSWDRWDRVYLYPPTAVLSQVVARLSGFKGQGVLIAPSHAQSAWYPSLLLRAPIHFPLPRGHSLSQETLRGKVFHPDVSRFSLHVWIL